ncbi:unnamed protein product [Rotaria sp. Silwood2]|nr:unnamed protein product [Rotaria sp. Silwood2]
MKHLCDALSVHNNSLQCLREECSLLKSSCEQTNTCFKKIKTDQDEFEEQLLKIKQLLEDLHYATYDGSFIWKITDVAQKIAEAQSGKQTSTLSPVFYSSPTGYKMRASLCLNGDGDAKGTHMSIFIVIFKGEYDAILWWPFNIRVVFCLFDQSGKGHHIIDRFDPDTTSRSFQRPTSENNIASGILKLCPLALITKEKNCFVQGDTMFIKIMLDFDKTLREILPYTLSVNPALPAHMQEAIRLVETEKCKKAHEALIAKTIQEDQEISRRVLTPMNRSVASETTQQPSTSTTNFEGCVPCEDISNE